MQAVIFDLDGLMINSEELSLQAWQAVLATCGRRLDDEDYHALIGMDIQATLNHVIQLTGVPLAWGVLVRFH